VSWARGSVAFSHTALDSPTVATLSRASRGRHSSSSRSPIRRSAPSRGAAPGAHPGRAILVAGGKVRDRSRREPDVVHTVRCTPRPDRRICSERTHGGRGHAVESASTDANVVERGVACRTPRSEDLVDQRTPVRLRDRVIAGWTRRLRPAEPNRSTMPAGAQVEVFNSFTASWVRGFEVASAFNGGYQVRRLSDHSVLPKTFVIRELRLPYS
jgi:hypothetical protein